MNDAKFVEADFIGAVLTDADLSNADLTKATLKNSQMAAAEALAGAILPDGSRMTSTEWPRFQRRHRSLWKSFLKVIRNYFMPK